MAQEVVYGSMVHENLLRRVRAFSQIRKERIDAVRTRAQALRYREQVRKLLRQCFGVFPKRTPLTPRITGVIERPTYTIEKVMFQSRPGLWVTANLYLPHSSDGKKKFPAVLGSCGHAGDGKVAGPYQSFGRTLAHNGFVCLIYDPIGQGERHQYLDQGSYGGPTCEHQMAGNAMSLVGDFFGTWRAWDGIRALDYLLSRPEVDRKHVGMTGNSGGGTLTTFISMLDDRITMTAASCLGSDYATNLENELPCDSEQNPPGVISSALNYADFFIAQAPRPTIILTQSEDFFDIRGLKRIHADTQKIFGLLGEKNNARIKLGTGQHGYSPELREAMVRFFREVVGYKKGYSEPDLPLESYETLSVTPTGQLSTMNLPGRKRVHDFTAATARELARTRKPVGDKQWASVLGKALTLPPRPREPHYRVLRSIVADANSTPARLLSRWGVETEQDIMAVLYLLPSNLPGFRASITATKGMTLYLPHTSTQEDFAAGLIDRTGDADFALDVRGIGVTQSIIGTPSEEFFARFGGDFLAAVHHQMLGESYIGRRVHDALVTLDLLAGKGGSDIHLTGRGIGGIVAAFAAVLHPAVTKVTLRNIPRSFHELTQTPWQTWPLSSLPWGILKVTDLPEMVRYLKKAKKVRIVEPWDAQRQPVKKGK